MGLTEEVKFTPKKANGTGPTPGILRDWKTLRVSKVNKSHFIIIK